MKKLIYTLATLASMVFAVSCEQEMREAPAGGETVKATFSVALPDAVGTKAEISDGTKAVDLTFAVYDASGNYLADLSKTSEENGPVTISYTDKKFTVTVPLVKDLSYKFLFVAKSSADNGFYTVDPAAKTLSVDYLKLPANDDNADIFYATEEFTVTEPLSKSIDLRRPVAQVNVGAADLATAAYSLLTDADNMTTGVTLTGLYPTLNLFEGTASGTAVDVTFTQAARVNETSAFVSGYDRVAMVYALVGEKQTVDATINITAKGKSDGVDHTITREVTNVPLQANYRTNILGNIFSRTFTFTINVDQNFATPDYNVVISTQEELDATIADINAGTSTATSLDISVETDGTVLDFSGLDDALTVPVTIAAPAAGEEAKTVVVENLKASQNQAAVGAVTVGEGAKLALNNSELISTGTDPRGLVVEKDAEVTIDGTTIDTHGGSYPRALQINDTDSKVSVTNSTIKSGHYPINMIASSGDAVVKFENTTIEGWCILNIWSSGNTFEFKNCTLKSINDKPYNADGWNDFAAFVFNKNTPSVDNNTVQVIDCELFVEATTGNKQCVANLGGQNNTLYCRNTVLTGTNTNTSGYLFSLIETGATYTLDFDDTVTGTWDGEDI